jgi:lipopolysaccharide biosynthesis glycosyltransferase
MQCRIAYAINDAYTKPLMAVLMRLFESKNDSTSYDIFVINHHLSFDNKDVLKRYVTSLDENSNLYFVDISDGDANRIPCIGEWGKETNYRLLLPELMPHLDYILYLDVDTMVMSDLSHLFSLDLHDKAVAGTNIVLKGSPDWKINAIDRVDQLLGSQKSVKRYDYTNAGVMLINLNYWRKHGWTLRALAILELMKASNQGFCPDQDTINYLLSTSEQRSLCALPFSYNASPSYDAFEVDKLDMSGLASKILLPKTRARICCDMFVEQTNDNLLEREFVQIFHMVKASPWNKQHDRAFRHFFLPYAQKVGLEVDVVDISDTVVSTDVDSKTHVSAMRFFKKMIKMLLPYGIVRLIQKSR